MLSENRFDLEVGETLVQRARELGPLLTRNAPLNEELGYLTEEVVEALVNLGAWKMAAPRRWGGLALSLHDLTRVTAELSRACASTGWTVGLMNSALWVGTLFPDQMQEELFADGIPRMCNVGSPGMATPAEGGYVFNGRWDYASGCHHSDWAQLMAIVPDDPPVPSMAILPMSDVRIENTWNVVGLKGTGSDTIVAEDVFVPAHRLHKLSKGFGYREPGERHVGEPSDFWPLLPTLKSKALGVLVGAAEGLVESVTQGVPDRPILFTSFTRRADSSVFQSTIGEATAKVSVARMIMDQSTSRLDEAAMAHEQLSDAELAAMRGQTAAAADLVLGITTRLMSMAGSSSFNLASPVQRFWRDLNVAGRHALLIPEMGYEILGRFLLGVEPNISPPDMY